MQAKTWLFHSESGPRCKEDWQGLTKAGAPYAVSDIEESAAVRLLRAGLQRGCVLLGPCDWFAEDFKHRTDVNLDPYLVPTPPGRKEYAAEGQLMLNDIAQGDTVVVTWLETPGRNNDYLGDARPERMDQAIWHFQKIDF